MIFMPFMPDKLQSLWPELVWLISAPGVFVIFWFGNHLPGVPRAFAKKTECSWGELGRILAQQILNPNKSLGIFWDVNPKIPLAKLGFSIRPGRVVSAGWMPESPQCHVRSPLVTRESRLHSCRGCEWFWHFTIRVFFQWEFLYIWNKFLDFISLLYHIWWQIWPKNVEGFWKILLDINLALSMSTRTAGCRWPCEEWPIILGDTTACSTTSKTRCNQRISVCKCLINQNPEQIQIRLFLHHLVFGWWGMLISSERPPIILGSCLLYRNGEHVAGTLCGDSCPTNGEETKAMFNRRNHGVTKVTISLQTCYDRSFLNLGSLQSSEHSIFLHWKERGVCFKLLICFFSQLSNLFFEKTYSM